MSASNNSRNLYRDPQKGKIAGVCAGLADYFGVETWIVRLLAITGLPDPRAGHRARGRQNHERARVGAHTGCAVHALDPLRHVALCRCTGS